LGDPPGIVDVGHRTAAGVAGPAPELHGHAGDVVPGFDQDGGRDRRVDSPGHGDEHAHDDEPQAGAGAANWRRRSMAGGTTARARSTSASVLGHPSDSRSEPNATWRGMPMAARTWDGSMAPLAHDEAAEAKTSPCSSR